MKHLVVWSVLLTACGSPASSTNDSGTDPNPTSDASSDAVSPQKDAAVTSDASTPPSDASTASGLWSLGYYASWDTNTLPVSAIEWSGLTHVAASFYIPQSDGSLSLLGGNPQVMQDLVTAAHANNVKAIASIGGADSGAIFETATTGATRAKLVASIVSVLENGGYDGVDIDWEPINAVDEPIVTDIANQIRAAHPGVIMTLALGYVNPNAPPDTSEYSTIAGVYDQLNIMSYGMAGAWQGWNSWHNSPIYQQDSHTPLSIDETVKAYENAGVPAAKLGVGIGFYGLCYSSPVSAPDQPLNGSTILASDGTMSYANIMSSYYETNARQWDSLALVPYLSFTSAHGPEGCAYVSYDDEQSITSKGTYVKTNGLGGVMQWEINEGYIAGAPVGQKNPLLTAIHDHVLN
jgi:chitinase